MNICINPFTLYGFLTILSIIGLCAFVYKLCNICNKKYTLDSNLYLYDSDSDSENECNNTDFSDDEHYD
jgi:hypothetical protein